MSSFSKISKRIHSLDPRISVTEERGCIVLTGEVENWSTVTKAGRLAVNKKQYYGVVNNIRLKGFEQHVKLPALHNDDLDGSTPDVLIIGGGLVGTATARELARYKLNVMLVDKGADIGSAQSSRNGGAVHVGVNYSPKSQKHIYNHRGNAMYDRLSQELDFPFERSGHFILIAHRWEKLLLTLLKANAKRLSIDGVRYLTKSEVETIEPHFPSWTYGALYMPTGGFTSPYKVAIALAENAVSNGVNICLNTAVLDMKVEDEIIKSVTTNRGVIYPKIVVNAAGVYADVIAEMANDRTFTIHPRKGTDIILDKKVGKYLHTTAVKSPITVLDSDYTEKPSLRARIRMIKFALSHENTSKGVAIIHTVDKNMIIGPDVKEIPDREDTTTEKSVVDMIIKEQMKLAEYISPSDVIAYFSGVRSPTYEEDFQIRKGIFTQNVLHAAGVQSPGATAAPAIAEDLAKWAVEYLSQAGEVTENTDFNPIRAKKPHPSLMSIEERNELIKRNPDYGQIVCRCEEISKGEILDALDSPLPIYTLDAIKRRCRPGMGRCQGGFCSPLVVQLLAEKLGVSEEQITKNSAQSYILSGDTKHTTDMAITSKSEVL